MDKAMQRRHKIRDKSFFFVWMACLIFSLFFIAYFFFLRTSEVDVTKHIILQYSGENGSASLRVRSEEISGNYENGVLKLTLPKKNPTTVPTSRRLDIQ